MIYYLETKSYNPFYNLAFEEYFFTKKPKGDIYIMLWQNDKSVIIGRYQNIYEEVNLRYANENNIKIVRRNSGGGAVFHDLGNINYSIMADLTQSHDIKTLSTPITQALKDLGAGVHFQGRNDIYFNDFKISGNAQYIKDDKILHHGTVLVQSNLNILSKVLSPKVKFEDSSAQRSITSRVCNLNDILNNKLKIADVKNKIKEKYTIDEEYKLSKEEEYKIKALETNKYRTIDWNYNKMPEFNYSNKKKFNFGSIEVNCLIENNIIKHIVFTGDFFALKDIEVLEKTLRDVSISQLYKINFEKYIKGIKNSEVLSLFETFNLNI